MPDYSSLCGGNEVSIATVNINHRSAISPVRCRVSLGRADFFHPRVSWKLAKLKMFLRYYFVFDFRKWRKFHLQTPLCRCGVSCCSVVVVYGSSRWVMFTSFCSTSHPCTLSVFGCFLFLFLISSLVGRFSQLVLQKTSIRFPPSGFFLNHLRSILLPKRSTAPAAEWAFSVDSPSRVAFVCVIRIFIIGIRRVSNRQVDFCSASPKKCGILWNMSCDSSCAHLLVPYSGANMIAKVGFRYLPQWLLGQFLRDWKFASLPKRNSSIKLVFW